MPVAARKKLIKREAFIFKIYVACSHNNFFNNAHNDDDALEKCEDVLAKLNLLNKWRERDKKDDKLQCTQ